MLKSLLLILITLSFFSCGTNNDEKLSEAILDAQIALGASDCQHAIDTLEGYGRVTSNAHYVKTLSSAYACRAGYSTPTFFSNDLALTALPPPLGGMTLYSTSKVAVANPLQDDSSFADLQTAINLLLYAGGISATTEPKATERAKYFSADEVGDLNSQLLFMELVQLGKYMRTYGNGSNTAGAIGLKGTGTAANKCFTSYNNTPLKPVINGLNAATFTCHSSSSSHVQLDESISPATTRKTRLCHGVVLLNGMFDLLPSVVGAASGGSLGAIGGLTAAITAAKAALNVADPAIGAVLTTISQTKCEDTAVVTVPNIESYFAGMFESVYL